MDLVQAVVTKIHASFYSQVDMAFCQTLISTAAQSNSSVIATAFKRPENSWSANSDVALFIHHYVEGSER